MIQETQTLNNQRPRRKPTVERARCLCLPAYLLESKATCSRSLGVPCSQNNDVHGMILGLFSPIGPSSEQRLLVDRSQQHLNPQSGPGQRQRLPRRPAPCGLQSSFFGCASTFVPSSVGLEGHCLNSCSICSRLPYTNFTDPKSSLVFRFAWVRRRKKGLPWCPRGRQKHLY